MSSKKKSSDSTVEHFTGKDMEVSVSQPREGFFCTLSMKARVPLPPDEVFKILTNPDNVSIFRSVKKVLNRKVVFESDGLLHAEVEHLAIWKLGFLKGTFKIKLFVEQNEPERTIRFRLAGAKGFMKDFTGGWKIHPYPYTPPPTAIIPLHPASITTTDNPSSYSPTTTTTTTHWHEQHKDHHRHGPLHVIHSAFRNLEGHIFHNNNNHHNGVGGDVVVAPMKPETSVVELEQSVAPAFIPPAPLAAIMRKISAAQIRHIMEDLRNEADRRIGEREGRSMVEGGRRGRRGKKNGDNSDVDGSGLAAHIKELDD